jgi:hypothetical protein
VFDFLAMGVSRKQWHNAALSDLHCGCGDISEAAWLYGEACASSRIFFLEDCDYDYFDIQ